MSAQDKTAAASSVTKDPADPHIDVKDFVNISSLPEESRTSFAVCRTANPVIEERP
jgi:hypothetical protein